MKRRECGRDYRFLTSRSWVRIPPALLMIRHRRGCSSVWQSAKCLVHPRRGNRSVAQLGQRTCFGSKGSLVRIQPLRLWIVHHGDTEGTERRTEGEEFIGSCLSSVSS